VLLPMLFEDDGLGSELEFTFFGTGFNTALLKLASNDPAIRTMLIDGCVALLLRGGRPGNLRPFITLHNELAVTPQEIGIRISDYTALVAADLGTVVAMAQRCLRKADEAGLLETDTLLAIAATILQRKEKGLVKTQTTWVRQAARCHPERKADLLATLAQPATPAPLPLAPPVGPIVPEMPPPITTPAAAAEELAAMLSGDGSVATMERVLAALIEMYGRDHEALRSAIRPVVECRRDSLQSSWANGYWLRLGMMLFDLLEPPLRTPMRLEEAFGGLHDDHPLAQPLHDPERSPATLMEMRLLATQLYLRRSPVPRLVATPTRCNGHLDPAVLVDRMSQAERDGWQPWRVDLSQALLRLPREDPGGDVRRRAEQLTSPAGQMVARQLRKGHVDPVVIAYAQHGKGGRYRWMAPLPERRVAVTIEPPQNVSPIETALFTLPRYEQPQSHWISNETLWAAALPSHREVVAAWAVTGLAVAADSRGGVGDHTQLLPLLAENHGPTGPATQLAIVYGMTVPDAADRVAAVDALLAFGNEVDWRAVGGHLGDTVCAGSLVLTRAARVLRDAAEAGAVDTAWQICLGALPAHRHHRHPPARRTMRTHPRPPRPCRRARRRRRPWGREPIRLGRPKPAQRVGNSSITSYLRFAQGIATTGGNHRDGLAGACGGGP
ncbi:MAG: hypothetical protein HOQ24_04740, partial [Mycobacteriaceae bacterium]|nr:hypothetical protein [Mycobacteriaceae bacterium]